MHCKYRSHRSPLTFLISHSRTYRRVGFSEPEKTTATPLPATVHELCQRYEVVERPLLAPTWDFVWNYAAEEGREKQLAQQAFVTSGATVPDMKGYSKESVHVADAALKMTLGTPNDTYDANRAAQLLHGVGQENVTTAVTDLLERGVISKLVRDPKKPKPGRTFKISETYALTNLLGL